MPTSSAEASRRQMEEYLRQLYNQARTAPPSGMPDYGGNYTTEPRIPTPVPTSPVSLTPTMTPAQREQQVIARNTGGLSGGFGGIGGIVPRVTSPGARISREPTNDSLAKLRAALEQSWIAQGMAPYSSSTLPNSTSQLGGSTLGSILGGSHIPPGGQTRNAIDVLRAALEKNWIAQGNAPYSSPTLPGNAGTSSHMPPGGYLHPQDMNWNNYAIPNESMRPNQIGTPNQTVIALEKARDVIEKRKHGQSLGLTSYDLDPNLQGMAPTDTGAWMDELMGLLGKPDIPGQWISPYSQDYLNQLGGRLTDVGIQGQAGYEGAKGEINDIYGQGIGQRDQRAQLLSDELQGAGSNIGINVAQSGQAQQAAADNAFLDQVSGQNQNTDLAYNTKLGQMTAQLGSNLGMQAREGLLTPKQYVGPQSGLSEGERLKAGFLMDEISRAQGQDFDREMARLKAQQDAKTASSSSSAMSDMFKQVLTQGAGDESIEKYPDLIQALGRIENPLTKEQALTIWEDSGNDPNKAATLIREMYAPVYDDPSTVGVNEAGEFAPQTRINQQTGEPEIYYQPPVWGHSYPAGKIGQASPGTSGTAFELQMDRYAAFMAEIDRKQKEREFLLSLFRDYNEGLGMTRTKATMQNDQKTTLNY